MSIFNSPEVRNDEIRIAISSVEENIRKLYEASKIGSVQILKTLIQEDPDLIQKALISSSIIESPIHMSVSHGHLEFTRLLLDHMPELATEVDAFQRTPLHLASANGDMETIQALLEKNTSACLVQDHNGLIPLHYAAMSEKIEIMQVLINARPQSVWMKLNNGQTVLHLCVEGNHSEAMKFLIEALANRDKDFLNTMDDAGNTILDLSLMLRQIEMVAYLLSISEVKTGTSITNFATSNTTKESPKSQKIKTRNYPKRQMHELSLSSSSPPPPAKKATESWKVWRKSLKYKGDWVQEVQGTMMLVATVIATVTFQAVINPPGGVWQQDIQENDGYKTFFPAGTAIMAYKQPEVYWFYLMANMVSFLASVTVVLLIISRFPLKNLVCSWMLGLAMCVAVAFLACGYLVGVQMVNINSSLEAIMTYKIYTAAVWLWVVVVGVVGLCYIIRFLIWLVKCAYRTFSSKDITSNIVTPLNL